MCNEQHERLQKAFGNVINCYNSNPAFLLSLFRSLPHFKSSVYAQQKLICIIDELMEQVNNAEEDEENEEVEEYNGIRSRIHLSTFKFIETILAGNETIAEENVQQIFHHVNSMMYSHLISHPSEQSAVGCHPMEAAQIMAKCAPILQQLTDAYSGQDISAGPMLAYDINRVFDNIFGWNELVDEEDDANFELVKEQS